MYGAIIGDLAGSVYEYDEFMDMLKKEIDLERRLEILKKEKLIDDKSFYSDDTILTIAILDAVLNKCDYALKLREYGLKYGSEKLNKSNYFDYMFSEGFLKWCKSDSVGVSVGNGCLMRVSPIAYLFNTQDDIKHNSFLSVIPSHNDSLSITSAEIVCEVIFLARNGYNKNYIKKYLEDSYNLKFNYKIDELRKTNVFDGTCNVLSKCLYILFISKDFEDSIRNAISIGGDTDTVACIVGSMAEALYGVPDYLIDIAKEMIPKEFKDLLDKAYDIINSKL